MGSSSSIINATCFILLTAVLIFGDVAKGLDTSYVDHSCEQNTWGDNQNYAELVTDLLDEVVFGVPADPYYLDYSAMSSGDDEVYGYGECNEAILMYECYDCLEVAHAELTRLCGDAVGGTMELVDCKIRYDNYDFYPN